MKLFKLINDLRLDKYVNNRLILSVDLLISIGVSFFAISLFGVLFTMSLDNDVVLAWLGGAFIFSLIFFLLLRTHKIIIRHSTLQEIWRLGVASIGKGLGIATILWMLAITPQHNALAYVLLVFDVLLR